MDHPAPTAAQKAQVLDDIFCRILADGERSRAVSVEGAPDWIPEPQTDPRYEDLDIEDWDKVPYPPERWIRDDADAELTDLR